MLILRRHWLPGEDDSPQSLAAPSGWITTTGKYEHRRQYGIIRAFKGS
ncbi:DUF6890 family protein [Escherichia coli]